MQTHKKGWVSYTNIKVDFRIRNTTKDKGHFIMIKESILQECIPILNIHVPNYKISEHMKQKLIELNGEIDKPTIKVEILTLLFQ